MSGARTRRICERLADALRSRALHPTGHPAVQTPLCRAAAELAPRLAAGGELRLYAVASLLVADAETFEVQARLAPLGDALARHGVAHLALRSGTSLGELEALVEQLAGPAHPGPYGAREPELRHVGLHRALREEEARACAKPVLAWSVQTLDTFFLGLRAGGLPEAGPARRSVDALDALLGVDEGALLARTFDRRLEGHLARHAVHAAILALGLARHLGLEPAARVRVGLAALLHDAGTVPACETALRKPGRLSDEDRRALAQHPDRGAELLARIGLDAGTCAMVRDHHRRHDGGRETRYGHAGILALADCYDALTGGRPYQRPLAPSEALRVIAGLEGSVYDPALVAALGAWLTPHPVGELVRLASGELALVEGHRGASARLRLVTDRAGRRLPAPRPGQATPDSERAIVCTADPLRKGIDVAAWLDAAPAPA